MCCVITDRPHLVGHEQIREHPSHGATVFHHIGDTGRRSQIVLEDSELSRLVSDQVDTRDVNSHTVGRHDAGRFTVEVLARGHQAARQHVIAQDSLLAVNVREEQLERLHSLLDTLFQPRPLLGGDDAWHQIQREGSFLPGQRKRHTLVDECASECVGTRGEVGAARRRQGFVHTLVRTTHRAVGLEHLVESQLVATDV